MWKHPFFKVVVFFLLLLVGSLPGFGQRTVVVVRHADKIDDTDDAVLSPTGEAQAKRLAHVLKDVGIGAIYTTQFKRTIHTAAPLARVGGYVQPPVDERLAVEGRRSWKAEGPRERETRHLTRRDTGRSGRVRARVEMVDAPADPTRRGEPPNRRVAGA